jgi:hypothetical protein
MSCCLLIHARTNLEILKAKFRLYVGSNIAELSERFLKFFNYETDELPSVLN